MTRSQLASGLLFVTQAACLAQPDPNATFERGPQPTSYHQDIKPLLESRCLKCHFEGGIAPHPFETKEDVLSHAQQIKAALLSREMPPWLGDDGCRDYIADRSLSDEQIQMVADWVDDGMWLGDPSAPARKLDFDENALERVDLTLEVPEPFTQLTEPDDYRCFLIPWPYEKLKYVTGFNAVPGTPEVVHHVVSFVIPPSRAAEFYSVDAAAEGPGYRCFGGPGGTDFLSAFSIQWLSAWAPGTQGVRFPPGTGVPVMPGSLIAVQVHYNSHTSGPLPDQSSIQVSVEDTVEREAKVVPFASPVWTALRPDGGGFDRGMLVPAYARGVVHSMTADFSFLFGFGRKYEIWAAALHMHERGTKTSMYKVNPDGTRDCLLDIPRWKFHWQFSYWFKDQTLYSPGDKLELSCEFDNSAENQPVYNGERAPVLDVIWGDTTADEMCVGVIYVVKPAEESL